MSLTRRLTPTSQPVLSENFTGLLLYGWGSHEWELDDVDPFEVFVGDDELREIWRTHREYVMAEAKRRGIAVPWALRQFEGEA